MFDKFGEFDSYEEINRAAKAQLEEGDLEAIKTIAEENGLDPEDAEDFCTGAIEELTTPSLAAMGKLELEAKDLSLTGALRDWTDFIEQLCLEDEEMAFAVRRKGKSLKECMALILKNAFNDKAQLDDRITKAEDGCSMVVSTELTLLRELTLMEIAMAAMEYMIIHPKRTWEKRERGAYAEKERSKAIGETKIAIARGKHPEVKGEYGTVIGLIVEDEKGKPVAAGVRNVDGIQAKAHQIYSMTEEREWVEVQK